MPAKIIEFGTAGHRRVMEGLLTACAAAATTIGPGGRYVAVDRNYGTLLVRDGVSVVRAISSSDPLRNMGVGFAREVAVRTSDRIGDGTTAAILILRKLCAAGVRGIAAGLDARGVSEGIDEACRSALGRLAAEADRAISAEVLGHVATIAANGDENCGRVVAAALAAAGSDGAITVIPGSRRETTVAPTEGFRIETTRLLDGAHPGEADSYDVLVLAHAGEIQSMAALEKVLLRAREDDRALVIVTTGLADAVRTGLARNNRAGDLDVTVLKLSGQADLALEMLGDLAAVTGGEVVDRNSGRGLEHVTGAVLGKARRAVFRTKETLFAEGGAVPEALDGHRRRLAARIAAARAEPERDRLRARLANLTGRAVVVEAGGQTELEAKERRDRLDTAARAARAAMQGGVVAGAGAALLRSAEALRAIRANDDAFAFGVDCMRQALAAPMRQIVVNAGLDPAGPVARVAAGASRGFDVMARHDADPAERGIFDAADVLAEALNNAASVARSFLLSGAVIAADEDPTRNYH
jgi:chaperonin GroEL